jgi:ubiquinone/menaquinone biosynthesis C-methylase UbiE
VAIEAESERDRDKRRRQRTLFDGIAERYEESRPGYPARVTEFVTTTANLAPGAEILEIGCGTGEDLAAAEESFDLIISSAAFHWIDPEVAFGKSARLLRPGGWLALLGTDEQYDHPLGPALDDLWVSHGDTGGAWDSRPSAPAHSAPDQAYIRHDGREVSAE